MPLEMTLIYHMLTNALWASPAQMLPPADGTDNFSSICSPLFHSPRDYWNLIRRHLGNTSFTNMAHESDWPLLHGLRSREGDLQVEAVHLSEARFVFNSCYTRTKASFSLRVANDKLMGSHLTHPGALEKSVKRRVKVWSKGELGLLPHCSLGGAPKDGEKIRYIGTQLQLHRRCLFSGYPHAIFGQRRRGCQLSPGNNKKR